VLLQPFLPETASRIFQQLNIEETSFATLNQFGCYKEGTVLGEATPLFQRIEISKEA